MDTVYALRERERETCWQTKISRGIQAVGALDFCMRVSFVWLRRAHSVQPHRDAASWLTRIIAAEKMLPAATVQAGTPETEPYTQTAPALRKDTTPPVITLNGGSNVDIELGSACMSSSAAAPTAGRRSPRPRGDFFHPYHQARGHAPSHTVHDATTVDCTPGSRAQ